jgi:transposase
VNLSDIKSIDEIPRDINILLPAFWSMLIENRRFADEVKLLKKELFGKKSEKQVVSEDSKITQEELFGGLENPVIDITKEQYVEVKASRRRKKHPGRNAIPEGIETVEHISDISEEEKAAAVAEGDPLVKIGEQRRVVIERVPAKYVKNVHIQYVYARESKSGVVTADAPLASPLPRVMAGLNLLVFVILSKYQYHLPLYRIQRQIFHESRIWFTRATMVGWIAELCVPLKRICREMIREVKSSDCIFSDDSRVKRAAHTSYMWIYVNGASDTAIFDYRDTRGAGAPREFLKGVSPGTYFMTDCLASYNDAVKRYSLVQMACMMHARREFVEAIDVGSCPDFARKILRHIGQLYRIERFASVRQCTAEERYKLRNRLSREVMEKIKQMLLEPGITVLPQSRIGKAINYTLNGWDKLVRFLDRGNLPIDNGVSERVIRDLAIGRKNWMTVQSDEGGKRMAILYSIIQTCKLNSIDPEEYFRDILMRLAVRSPEASVADLTPVEWLKAKNGGILPPKQDLYPSKS